MKSDRYKYDRFAGCEMNESSADADELVRVQRLAGIDFASGVFNMRGHGLDSVMQACYRIEYRRLKGVKTFSFQ
jgi:hypothetical protein